MKASQFSDAQNAFILKPGDEGVSVAEICRKAGSGRRPISTGRKNGSRQCPEPVAITAKAKPSGRTLA